jgi:hypothetical protein
MLSTRLLPSHRSCHQTWAARRRSSRKHQIRPGGSSHRLQHATEANSTQHLQLQPNLLHPAPRLSLLRTASPLARASVRPGKRETTLKRKRWRRAREEKKEKSQPQSSRDGPFYFFGKAPMETY